MFMLVHVCVCVRECWVCCCLVHVIWLVMRGWLCNWYCLHIYATYLLVHTQRYQFCLSIYLLHCMMWCDAIWCRRDGVVCGSEWLYIIDEACQSSIASISYHIVSYQIESNRWKQFAFIHSFVCSFVWLVGCVYIIVGKVYMLLWKLYWSIKHDALYICTYTHAVVLCILLCIMYRDAVVLVLHTYTCVSIDMRGELPVMVKH